MKTEHDNLNIETLEQNLSSESKETKIEAVTEIINLTKDDSKMQIQLCTDTIIGALIDIIRNSPNTAGDLAISAIDILTYNSTNYNSLGTREVRDILVSIVMTGSLKAKIHATRAIANLCRCANNCRLFSTENVRIALVLALNNTQSNALKYLAVIAVRNIIYGSQKNNLLALIKL